MFKNIPIYDSPILYDRYITKHLCSKHVNKQTC